MVIRYLFSGMVQGVGFRFRARRIGNKYSLSGKVKNLDDGRVEIILLNEQPNVDKFISELRDEFRDKVIRVDLETKVQQSVDKNEQFIIDF